MAIPEKIAKRNDERLNELRPSLRPVYKAIIKEAEEIGIDLIVTEVARTNEKQLGYWRIGRTVVGENPTPEKPMGDTITKAKTAEKSAHGIRGWPKDRGASAVDFAILIDGKLVSPRKGPRNDSWDHAEEFKLVGMIAEEHGQRWGGRFGESTPGAGDGWDGGHVESTDWRKLPI